MRTIKEEEVDLSEYEDFADAWRQLGRFLECVQPEADPFGVGVLDAERVRATMDRHAEIAVMGLTKDPLL